MKPLFFLLLIFSYTIKVQSQSLKETTADKYYDMLAYAKAVTYYKELAVSKNASAKNIRRTAECYRNLNDHVSSVKYYEMLINSSSKTNEDIYYYFQALKSTGNYSKADQYIASLTSVPQYAVIGKHHADDKNYFNELKADSANFKIKDAGINSEESDFSLYINNNDFYFASNRRNVATVNKKFAWDDTYFLDEYMGKFENGMFKDVKVLPHTVDSKYHEGPAIVSADGKTMYITRSNYIDKKLGKDTKRQINIKLFVSRKNDKNEWGAIEEFPFNKDDYSIGHPALSKDGQILYFISDMPGGYGQTDIYKTSFVNGTWARPENLGNKINTEGREMFPYIYEDGTLFFSSDGNAGLGGLDVYSATFQNNEFSEIKNLGYPINTQYDDFGIYLNADSKTGYISSNRTGGKGSDDIYGFESVKSIIAQFALEGIVTDKYSNLPLINVSVDVYDEKNKLVTTLKTDDNGAYKLPLQANKNYKIQAIKEEYYKDSILVSTINQPTKKIEGNIFLKPNGVYAISGSVTDSKTKQPLNNVAVFIKDRTTGNEVLKLLTTPTGGFEKMLINVNAGSLLNYSIQLQKAGYITKDITFTKTLGNPEIIKIDELLDISMVPIGTEAEQPFVINPIFFDLNKSDIRADAQLELNKLADVLNQKKDLKVEITSHTDCRATEAYNMNLSQRRAYATCNYLVNKGVSKSRLNIKWVGETQLTTNCACEPTNESSCSEEEHQQNRRSNFKIEGRKSAEQLSKN